MALASFALSFPSDVELKCLLSRAGLKRNVIVMWKREGLWGACFGRNTERSGTVWSRKKGNQVSRLCNYSEFELLLPLH